MRFEKIKLDGDVLPGRDHRVSFADGIKSKELAGNSSSTKKSHQGYKNATISVSFVIKDDEPDELTRLKDIFHEQENEEPKKREITYKRINAWGIDKVQFQDDIRINEDDRLKLSKISFTLKQVESSQEATEQRTPQPTSARSRQYPANGNRPAIDRRRCKSDRR